MPLGVAVVVDDVDHLVAELGPEAARAADVLDRLDARRVVLLVGLELAVVGHALLLLDQLVGDLLERGLGRAQVAEPDDAEPTDRRAGGDGGAEGGGEHTGGDAIAAAELGREQIDADHGCLLRK
jgi:hypothetical protein